MSTSYRPDGLENRTSGCPGMLTLMDEADQLCALRALRLFVYACVSGCESIVVVVGGGTKVL